MDNSLQNTADLVLSQAAIPTNAGRLTGNRTLASIDKTSHEFENMFMSQMLQPMFEGLGVDQVFGGGHGEEVMRNLMIQEYGKVVAKTGRFGVADSVKKQMIRSSGLSPEQTTILQGD